MTFTNLAGNKNDEMEMFDNDASTSWQSSLGGFLNLSSVNPHSKRLILYISYTVHRSQTSLSRNNLKSIKRLWSKSTPISIREPC